MTNNPNHQNNPNSPDEVRDSVRNHYAQVAQGGCGCGPGCCSTGSTGATATPSIQLGYSATDLAALPEGADMGLGCGSPLAFAALQQGEVVLDLGSGGGIDCLLAARQVGTTGRVIGVDMTPEMIRKARDNAARVSAANVELRLGEIERLPVADRSVDVVVSNCVVNLSPDKPAVLRDVFRVLRAGGRVAIADVVIESALPSGALAGLTVAGCIAGAATVSEMTSMLSDAGFIDVRVDVQEQSRSFIKDWAPGTGVEGYVASAHITARKPVTETGGCCGGSCC